MMKKRFAKKSLGQNFLQSTEIRDRIIASAGNITGKNILEIGPGLGFLTSKILEKKANLTAVEFDPRAVEILKRDFGHKENFHLVQGDILDQDLDSLRFSNPGIKDAQIPGLEFPYAIVANIPYNITAPILRKILEKTKHKPQFAILMVQKEVAQKISPPSLDPGIKDPQIPGLKFKRSILSIAVEVFSECKILFQVPRICFSPSPKVDSAVIRLDIRPEPLVPEDLLKDFFTVVNAGFSEKRKKLSNSLGKFFGTDSTLLLGSIDGNRRPETLTIDEWKQVTHNFQAHAK
ncbi:16S rRNA (adenine(1518)-N(6)/adenine(1519)-N(6))-dimethyltransferase RsmA [Candidatus Gracilibacteria bacterium]|nr:16S rRNA (adenine(1518)-N(6)/adenine(1519)-N(6))-dimethyltransferase RsmA [Candidatus Gracilibacteria bacterium]